MSIRSGFFNSIGSDRRYNAEDMGKMFEGIISDGVFNSFGDRFEISIVEETMKIRIKSGKAWFEGKYFEIDGFEELTLEPSDSNARIDAIYIGINNTEGSRSGFVGVQKGAPALDPVKPVVESTSLIIKKVVGYVRVNAYATSLDGSIIESNVGNASKAPNYCPYSETTGDPRRGLYIYDSSSELDPYLNEYVVLEDFCPLEPDGTHPPKTIFEIDYPDGFNLNNTIIVSIMFKKGEEEGNYIGWQLPEDALGNNVLSTSYVRLEENKIVIKTLGNYYTGEPEPIYKYKLVLMRFEEESNNE